MDLTIVVLAAGQGARMESRPMESIPSESTLAGKPLVSHVVDAARALEPANTVVVAGSGAEPVRQAVGNGVAYVTGAGKLGAGHALQQAAPVVAGQAEVVLVLCGDTPLIRPGTLQRLVEHHNTQDATVTLLSSRAAGPGEYGYLVRDAETGRVLALLEESEATPEQRALGEVSSGILCFRDEWLWPNLARLGRRPDIEIGLDGLVAMALDQGELVTAFPVADPLEAIGLDNRLKLAQAEAEMRWRINESWMLAGVILVHPAMTYIDAGVEIGAGTVIWPNTFLQGRTEIGQGCTIGPGTVIRDSTIGDGCRVELSVVEGAIMEEGSEVGPFGHLRKGAHLGPGAHMGNFGEVKNSYLGPGVKMGHMSYLGDATVGAEANIGAGTITCNYDGQHKHRTTIGEGAFIGSDTMLVAPVEIGDGAKTGAGSVVTRDVPAGSVAYGVPARVQSTPSSSPTGPVQNGAEGKAAGGEMEESEVESRDHG